MKLTLNWLFLSLVILCVSLFSGCTSSSPYTKIENVGPAEKGKIIEDKKIIANEKAAVKSPDSASMMVTSFSQIDQAISPTQNAGIEQKTDETAETGLPTDLELIDRALEYIQTSSDFLERGDQDNAIDALDKAYSYLLKMDGYDDPELSQQREDIRYTISKLIMDVYSSTRPIAVNGNHNAIPLDMNSYVQREIDSFKNGERKFFLEAYARSGKYRPAIIKALKEAGLPEELSWLPLIESGFKNSAFSSARALGMWQFIASTGYRYGLKRDTWIDERMDTAKATTAAIGYLSDLHLMFGDWTTVLAAYNCGEKRVQNEINRQKISYLDNFWDLYQKLPNETARYVPRFLAVLHIVHDPAAYGFELPQLEDEIQYEEVTIDKQLSLATIAKSINVDNDTLKSLNAELRQNTTPKTAYNLKLPVGKGEVLLSNLSEIPATTIFDVSEKNTYAANTYHTIRSGETLSSIARKYRTSVKAIMNANGLKSQKSLKVGSRLMISTHKKTIIAEASQTTAESKSTGEVTRYVVKKGDSLYNIAKRFNTTTQSLKVINGISAANLSVGQELIISPGRYTASKEGETKKYTVRKGDYPYIIAKKYNMDLYDFLKINGLSPASTIFPGQEVQVTVE